MNGSASFLNLPMDLLRDRMTRRAAMKSPAAGSQREGQIKYQQGINYGSRCPTWLYMTRLLYTWIYNYM